MNHVTRGLASAGIGKPAPVAATLWVIVTAVFLATRITGNPIDFLMPEGMDAESRATMIAYKGSIRQGLAGLQAATAMGGARRPLRR